MTPERYQQIKALYHAALERAVAERLPFVAQACGEDAELRAEVESLLAVELAVEFDAQGFVDSGGAQAALPTLPGPVTKSELTTQKSLQPASFIGARIGAYKLLKEIGHGGMGAVYLTERADREYKQRVALKLIKRGMDTDEIIARFRHERQILAALDHPNIARLLDGGTTADGLPYFVMEHVEGEPLDVYCAAHQLSLRERLELFRTVCGAVHYAHQNLVVHRDLKPANILVTGEGVPKLLDFGIAKVLNSALMFDTLAPTATSARPMTPAYASPEQVRGQTITTASDVYALGVILYETLTEQRPYEVEGMELSEVVLAVCESVPNRPSTAVVKSATVKGKADTTNDHAETARWRKQLEGDLDNIVLMALRKEPQRRYASVEQFSEDIRRHLVGLPVIARDDTFKYRAGKFVRRNRAAVAAASLIAALLLAFLATTLVQAHRIERERDRAALERDRAALERDKAEKVSAFLVELFKINDPSEAKGNQVTARELLDKGAAQAQTELKGQPEVQANLLNTIGEVYERLGLFQRAEELLTQTLRANRQALGHEHAETARTLSLMGTVYYDQANYAEAVKVEREALAIRRKLYGNEHKWVAESWHNLAVYLRPLGKDDEVAQCWEESLAIRRKLYGPESLAVAEDYVSYATYFSARGDNDSAERVLRISLRILRQHYPPENLDLMTALNNLASTLGRKRNYAEAASLHRELLATKRRIYGAEHPDLALTLNNLGYSLRLKGDLAEAETVLREAVAMRRKLLGANHPHTALATLNLGRVLLAKGLPQEAEPLLRGALRTIQQGAHTEEDIAYYQHGLGDCFVAQRRFAEAESLLIASYQTYQTKRGAQHMRTIDIAKSLDQLYQQWGKPEKAAAVRAQN